MFDFLVATLAVFPSCMFVIGVAGCDLLAIPSSAYQLFKVLFEKDEPEKQIPTCELNNGQQNDLD